MNSKLLISLFANNKIGTAALLYWLLAGPAYLIWGDGLLSERVWNFGGLAVVTWIFCTVLVVSRRRKSSAQEQTVGKSSFTRLSLRWMLGVAVTLGLMTVPLSRLRMFLLVGSLLMPFVMMYFTLVVIEDVQRS